MPKIRDLGINVIPATMRPPEIGPGGCGPTITTCQLTIPCAETCPSDTQQCLPSGRPRCTPKSNCAEKSHGKYASEGGGLTPGAIIQLKQQLQDRIGTQLQR
jgi:hypothetical protein